jgi:glucose-1-phosphate adenylyltransferase
VNFISAEECKNVLILSGDHVYYMDYRSMLRFHHEHGAKVTISVLKVPWEETHQFGTAVVDSQYRIMEWEEKSPRSRSNLASMGVYIFEKNYLVRLLESSREEDFGYNLVPKAVQEGKVFAYPFDGYWRDVGTLQAYWDANMDIVKTDSGLNPESWGTMTNLNASGIPYDRPPIKIARGSNVTNSAISPGCIISGKVENSVLSPGVVVEKGALVKDSIIMHDTVIRERTSVERCIIDKYVLIGRESDIGRGNCGITNHLIPEHLNTGLTLIGKEAFIPDNVTIGTNCIIHSNVEAKDFPTRRIFDGENIQETEVSQ